MTLGIEGGPFDGREITVPVGEHGRPAGEQVLDGARYVLRMWGVAPHPEADWHYCHVPQQDGL
ncbi:hypothetical protein [Streptomyces sp. KN37]|uniref:hypothetical protein n=1 Tax=Streptomyces sp. KN37 TaxID=3090667 RepID=UPI002A759EBB|nr:hypothetical protein [Streptomyces sp. KN37]WPO74013.1 hypothetical protein R9806_27035 [Streptomyces sp. KN37]